MKVVKKSITIPKELDSFIVRKSRKQAKARGGVKPNYSAALVDIVLAARNSELPVSV